MSISDIIVRIMMAFMVLGALDRAIGNRFKLGEKFEEGINAMGALALAMVGVVALAPVLASILKPVVGPVYAFLGADPAMFATTLLANDMGGYPLAMKLALTPEAGRFAGIILGAMLGPTIVFSIPVALGIIKVEDRPFLARGILAGIVTIPLGCIAGGLVGWGFDVKLVFGNLLPIVIASALIAIGLWKIPDKMTRGFIAFGKGLIAVISVGLGAAILQHFTGIVTIPGLDPIFAWNPGEGIVGGLEIIANIGIMLAGAYPMVYVITKVLNKPLMSIGGKLGMNEYGAAGMVATLANNIPMFAMMKDMNNRAKVLNCAFAVSAAFTFGDHLGFTAAVEKDLIFAMVVGKLVAGVTAVAFAAMITPKDINSKGM